MRESGVMTAARARGASSMEVGGCLVPAAFGDAAAEYRALREDAALLDLGFLARLRVTGSDRLTFLQGMLSNDLQRLEVGQGCRALLLTDQGKVVADLVALVLAEAVLLEGVRPSCADTRAALERYVVADDVEIADVEDDHALGLFGPGAPGVLTGLGAVAPTQSYAFASADLLGTPVRIVRAPLPAPGGFVCHVPRDAAPGWWLRVVERGVVAAGHLAFDVLRIESGLSLHGRDVTRDTLALEGPVEDAISFSKGCYLGQEVVERVTARGHVNRRLVGLVIEGGDVPADGERVFAADREVGWVTSAAWSWRLGHPVALGYVRREHLEPGTRLEVRGDTARRAAIVRALPFG